MPLIEKVVTPSIQIVQEFCASTNVALEGLPYLATVEQTMSHLSNYFNISFKSGLNHDLHEAWSNNLPDILLHRGDTTYSIPNGSACFMGSLHFLSSEIQDFNIKITHLIDTHIDAKSEYYIRIFQPIDRDNWLHDIATYAYTEGRNWTLGLLEVELANGKVHMYPYKTTEQNYMVTDILFTTSIEDARHIAFSTALALGLITTDVHLDEYYFIFSKTPEFRDIEGLAFFSLRPTVYGQYRIFTTNIYSLEHSLKQTPSAQYALSQLYTPDGEIQSGLVDWMNMEVFSNLARNIYENDSLSQSASILIETSTYPLEYQGGLFCLALEAITSVLTEQDDPHYPMPYQDYETKVKPHLDDVLNTLHSEGMIDETVLAIFKKRVKNDICKETNGDKLKEPFNRMGYQLTKIDNHYINKRNNIFHGKNIVQKGKTQDKLSYMLHLCLLLHKLCSILLLKQAGYSGYIINNPVLYGCAKECKAKEDVLIQI